MSQWFVLEDDSAGADTITPLLAALHTATSAKYSGTVVQSTRVSAHSANRILVKANITDAERTGALAALARDQLGVGIFKDEFVGHPDKELRVFGLLGEGEYAGQVWYIRPRITYSTVDQTPTRITLYGDGSGKTYGDAIAGPKGWQDNLVNVTTMFRAYLVGEHIMGEADTPADGTLESAGVIDVTRSGTSADVRTELRFDYPEITHNGAAFDRGVYYGGLMLNGAGKSWTEGVIKLPYAPGTALVAGDNGLTITMDTDGDTGRIIDFDGSHIWVATDGAVANSFDNLPTSNDTFTITTGTGTGSQNGAGTLESGVYWYTIPSSMASGTWLYDPGSAFGNSVNKNTHTTRSPHWGGTMTVQDANGGNELIKQDSVADVASTESSYRRAVAATNGVAVVHLAGGTDPTNRVMAQGFGIRLDLSAAIDNVLLLGERARVVHNQQGGANTRLWPINNFRVEDFSRKYSNFHMYQFDVDQASADCTNHEFLKGYVARGTAGIYPAMTEAVGSIRTIVGWKVHDVVAEDLGGAVNGEQNGDGHAVAHQGNVRNVDVQRIYTRRTGGSVNLYQFGEWRTFPTHHLWGDITVKNLDIADHSPFWPNIGSGSSDAGFQLGGDNNDEASIGNGKAVPSTRKQDLGGVLTFEDIKVCGDWVSSVRVKWRDFNIPLVRLDLDGGFALLELAGADTNWFNPNPSVNRTHGSALVVKIPYTQTVALVDTDINKNIVLTVDGDTGEIVDFDATHIWVSTDGVAGNEFDNAPTANGAFTITGGTGTGTQTGVGVFQPRREPRVRVRDSVFGSNCTNWVRSITTTTAGDYVYDGDDNTFKGAASDAKFDLLPFGAQTFAQFKTNARASAETYPASVFEPNSLLEAA